MIDYYKSVAITIFVELIDQLIYYPINCASLSTHSSYIFT